VRRIKQQVAADLFRARRKPSVRARAAAARLYSELQAHHRASVLGRLDQVGLAKRNINPLPAVHVEPENVAAGNVASQLTRCHAMHDTCNW